MEIRINDDLKQLTKKLDALAKTQVPFATSQAINDVAFLSRKALRIQAPQKLDRPTPFTVNSFRVSRSTKRSLEAVVYIAPIVYAYLKNQLIDEDGSSTHVVTKKTAVPVNIKLNKYGNIPGRKTGIVKKRTQFAGTRNGVTGIWERDNKTKRITLLAGVHKRVTYRGKFAFYKIVAGVVKSNFAKQFDMRLENALRNIK